nr:MAG TPA: minor tail protein [Caudoviricetes sp.]
MAVSYKGLVIKFGGDTTELQSALKKVQKASRGTQSDLRDINKALKFDPGNTELLEQKVKALNSAYGETKQKLDAYKQALAQLESKKQSGAQLTAQEERQYDSLKRAIVQCERQLDSYGTELADTSRQAEGSKTAIGKLGQAIEGNADSISSAGSKVSSAGTAISGGVVGAATALTGLAASQEEAIRQSGQLETAWVSAGGTAEQASSTYAMFYRILGESDTATEASQNLARLTTNEQELKQWTNIAAGAYATFGDALPLENLAEAAQETAHTGTVTGGLADALNWSTASAEQWSAALSGHSSAQAAFNQAVADGQTKEDAFNAALAACGSEQERSQLITETLTGLYADAGRQYQETNKDLLASRDAQNEMNQSMQELGEAALPVKTAVTEIGTSLLSTLAPALEAVTGWYKSLSPEQQTLVNNLALGAVAFGGVTTAVGKTMEAAEGVGNAFKTAGELWGGAKKLMGDTGFLSKIGTGFTNIVSKAGGLGTMLTGTLSSGWTGFTGLIAAHPIGLGVAAVSAAVGGLTWFFTQTETGKQMWSDFTGWISEKWQGVQDFFAGVPEFWGGIWEQVSTGVSDFCTGVGEKWEQLKQGASDTWENIKTDASNAWNDLKTNVGNLAQGAVDTVSNWWSNLTGSTESAFGQIASTVQNDMNTAQTVGSSAAGALQSAMNGDWETAKSQAANAFNAIRSNISDKLSAAQSTAVNIADQIGNKLGFPGLGSKVQGIFNNVKNAISNPIQNAWNAISSIPSKIMNAFSGIRISIPKPKLPHFNVSWNDFGPISLPSVGISWYARGGYFNEPSIVGVGEAGGEFIAPEKQLQGFIETSVNRAFSRFDDAPSKPVSVAVTVYATVADGVDAYETGQQIGAGIASKLKQRGVPVAT